MENENQGQMSEDMQQDKPIEEQVRDQTGKRQIRLNYDEKNLKTSYANGFRTASTSEEIILDFGLNYANPSPQEKGDLRVVFLANDRIIMNYYSAKRLAINLSQIVRKYEQQYGEIELNAAKRRKVN